MSKNLASSIPIELLGAVFQLLCIKPIDIAELHNPKTQELFPWAAGLVCRHWRYAFVSFPALWASLHLRSTRHVGRCEDELIRRLSIYLSRSESHPLDIVITHYPSQRALDLLLSHSYRWRCVNLVLYSPQKLEELTAYKGKMPLLEEVTLSTFIDSPDPCHGFAAAPSLTRAILPRWTGNNTWILPWSQLTKLVLKPANYSELVANGELTYLLHKVNGVEDLHIYTGWRHGQIEGVIVQKLPIPVPLSSLRSLKIHDPFFLLLIDAPKLYELQLLTWFPIPAVVERLFRQILCKPRRLILNGNLEIITRLSISCDVEDLHILETARNKNPSPILVLANLISSGFHLPQLRLLTVYAESNAMVSPGGITSLTRILELRARKVQSSSADFDAISLERVTLKLRASKIPDELSKALMEWTHVVKIELVKALI